MRHKFGISIRRMPVRERWACGLMFVLGLATFLQAIQYTVGTMARMGPGLFPALLGVALMIVAVLLALVASAPSSSMDEEPEEEYPPQWRGWLCIIGGVVAFIVLGQYGGLVPATFLLVFISALGDRSHSVISALLLAAFVTVLGVAIFSWGLSLQFPLFRWG